MNQEVQTGVQQNPLATEKVSKLIIKFGVPSVVAMLVNSLYNIVDQIFIGNGVGYLGNAATNVAFPMVTISLAIALLIGDGGAAYFSLKLGEGDKEKAAKGLGNMVTVSIIAGALFLILGLLFFNPLLGLFGATDKVLPYAQQYTQVIILGLPFMMISTALNASIRADSSPKFAMVSMLTGAVINTILDPIFIFVFKWGVAGAAWATIIGQIVGCIISLCYLGRFKNVKFQAKLMKLDWKTTRTFLSFGVSSFITQVAVTLVIIVSNNVLRIFGAQSVYGAEIPLSVFGIVMKVNQILMSFFVGLSVGGQPIIGFNYGARNFDRVKKTYLRLVTIATIIAVVGWIAFMFFPEYIVAVFGQGDALYQEFALKCFRLYLMFCFANGFQIVSSIYFQAIGKPIRSSILSLSRQILFLIPMLLILPIFFGVEGALYAGAVADAGAAVLAAAFIMYEMKRLDKKHLKTLKNAPEGV